MQLRSLIILREQSRYKDQILATISHGIRTTLNGIIGILDCSIKELGEPLRKILIIFLILQFIFFFKILLNLLFSCRGLKYKKKNRETTLFNITKLGGKKYLIWGNFF